MQNNKAMYLGSFFESDESSKVNLSLSYDGERFEKLNTPFLWANGGTGKVIGRDPSIIFHGGWWLIAVSGFAENIYDVDCWRSRDLTVWELVRIKIGDTPICGQSLPGSEVVTSDVWAPDWFADGEYLYLTVNLRFYADQTDSKGTIVKSFKPYISKCINLDTLSFGYPVAFSVPPNNMIDATLNKIFNTYYLIVKNEISKMIEIYYSSNVVDYYNVLAIVPFGAAAEGPTATYLPDGTIRIYADYYDTKKWTYFVDTKDFITFTTPKPVLYRGRIKHGTVVNCNDFDNPAQAIQNITSLFSMNSNFLVESKISKLIDSAGGNVINSGGVNTWWPEHGFCYYTEGVSGNVILEGLPTTYPDGSFFYFIIRSKTPGYGDIIIRKATGDAYHPANGLAVFDTDLVLKAGSSLSNQMFKMVCFDGQWWPEGI